MSSRDQGGSPVDDMGEYVDTDHGESDERARSGSAGRGSDHPSEDDDVRNDDDTFRRQGSDTKEDNNHHFREDRNNGRSNERDGTVDESLAGSRRIFVGNLPWSTTGEDCVEYFSKYGPVEKAQIIYRKDEPGRSRGIAFVTFTTEEATQAAANDKGAQMIGDRELNIEVATMQGHGSAGHKFRYRGNDRSKPGSRGGRNEREPYPSREERDRAHRSSAQYERPDRQDRRRERAALPRGGDPYDGYRPPREDHMAPPSHRRGDMYTEPAMRGGGRRGEYMDDMRGGGGRDPFVVERDRDRGDRRGTPPGASYATARDTYDVDPRDRRGMVPMSRDMRDMRDAHPVRGGGGAGYVDDRVAPPRGSSLHEPRDGFDQRRGGGGRDGPYYDGPPSGGYRDEERYASTAREDAHHRHGGVYNDTHYARGAPIERSGRYESDMMSGGSTGGGYTKGGRGDDRAGGRPQGPPVVDRRAPPSHMDRGSERYERDYVSVGDRYINERAAPAAYDDYHPPSRSAGARGDRQGGMYNDGGDYGRGGPSSKADRGGAGGGERYSSRGGPQGPETFYARGHGVYERGSKDGYASRRAGGR